MRGYAEKNPFERERRALGRAIKEIRLKKKMTQEDLADKASPDFANYVPQLSFASFRRSLVS